MQPPKRFSRYAARLKFETVLNRSLVDIAISSGARGRADIVNGVARGGGVVGWLVRSAAGCKPKKRLRVTRLAGWLELD
jgi:hypothetical protein